jgi:predicted amidohydrolase YtcJ
LRETATDLVWKQVPEPTDEEIAEAAGLAVERIVQAGVTSLHWIATSRTDLTVLQKLLKDGKLPLRVYIIVPANLLDEVSSLEARRNFETDNARIGGVEIYADGFLSSKTAALLEPYSDDQTQAPLLCTKKDMAALTAKALDSGFQPVIHAMGDKAIDAALAAIEKAAASAAQKNVRPRIDEAAVLNTELVKRMRQQAVVVSVQPCVMASEFSVYSAVTRLGPARARWVYPLKTLFKEVIRVCGGSDCPMEPLNPLLGIQSAVSRQFFPEEQLTVDEALRMYTLNAAHASSEENLKGSIGEGKLADFTVISQDPHEVPSNEIHAIAVEMTIVGGRIVYSR